ncbi:hypothetical protein JZ751_017000 [Albula glossodonta]|uniref:ABC transmembrane type-1 domain-containing protein n=1 Tax=Albula glossodonta TaxID=121402 RepID=A0A8T2N1P2_9TELE|nr:hypothetical protein JZ751_017000 [Albula glossodonta]
MRVKSAVMGLVYRKSLVITSAARRACTVGEIVNLVSADTQKLMDFVVYFNAVWVAPIEIVLCLYFLWQHLGPSALAGITTVILIFPLNGFIAKKRSKLLVGLTEERTPSAAVPGPVFHPRPHLPAELPVFIRLSTQPSVMWHTPQCDVVHTPEEQMHITDGRIKLMSEILGGIKILKLFAWERAFQQRVLRLRERELQALRSSHILQSMSIASFNSSTFLVHNLPQHCVHLSALQPRVGAGEGLSHDFWWLGLDSYGAGPDWLFAAVVQIAFAMFGVYVLTDCRNVLDAQKVFVSMALINILKTPLSQLPFAISTTMQVRPGLNIRVPRGSLVAVVGQVGSGKSSLLAAMLGEMEKRNGHVTVRATPLICHFPSLRDVNQASLMSHTP